MKNIKYIIFTILFLFINVFSVNASCTDEEINDLKKLADDIKITYKHLGKVENVEEDTISYDLFDVKIKNMSDDLYISLFNDTIVITPVDGEAVETFNSGTWDFEVYSNKCGTKITTIEVYLPRFNIYSLDPLCEGIDGDDFALCGKYYEYDVSYDSFKERVTYYRSIHVIEEDKDDVDNNGFKVFLNRLYNYILEYRLYIVITLAVILVILIIIIITKRIKKRGVLE